MAKKHFCTSASVWPKEPSESYQAYIQFLDMQTIHNKPVMNYALKQIIQVYAIQSFDEFSGGYPPHPLLVSGEFNRGYLPHRFIFKQNLVITLPNKHSLNAGYPPHRLHEPGEFRWSEPPPP